MNLFDQVMDASGMARAAARRTRRQKEAIVTIVVLAAWCAFWFWPPSISTRRANLEMQIQSLRLEQAQMVANAKKGQIDNQVILQAANYDISVVATLAELERLTQAQLNEHRKATDSMISRLEYKLESLRE